MSRLAALLLLAPLTASAADPLVIDFADPTVHAMLDWASPTYGSAHIDLRPAISLNTRTAYTAAAPLQIPCDVTFLAIGPVWRNTTTQAFYPEMSASLYVGGDEHVPLANVYGQTRPLAPSNVPTAAGQLGTGGFIFLTPPPLFDFTTDPTISDASLGYLGLPNYTSMSPSTLAGFEPGYLPANVTLKANVRVRAFSSTAWDPARGGFALANEVVDTVVWNNAYNLWIRRVCA